MICTVCDRTGEPGPVSEYGARESLCCPHCGASSRMRAVARAFWQALYWVAATHARVYQVGGDRFSLRLRRQPRMDVVVSELHRRPGCVVEDIERLTFPAGAFHIVLCSDVLEHIRDYELALAEFARVIVPAGYLILTTGLTALPRHEEFCVRHPTDPRRDAWAENTPRHLDPLSPRGCPVYRTYSRSLLEEELGQVGFEVSVTPPEIEYYAIRNGLVFMGRRK